MLVHTIPPQSELSASLDTHTVSSSWQKSIWTFLYKDSFSALVPCMYHNRVKTQTNSSPIKRFPYQSTLHYIASVQCVLHTPEHNRPQLVFTPLYDTARVARHGQSVIIFARRSFSTSVIQKILFKSFFKF